MHQYPRISNAVEIDNIDIDGELFSSDKKIGIRHIGIWNDADYARHLYLLIDEKDDNNWKQVVHWVDRGQYTAIVKKLVDGPFKSPPPYRDYPYGEDAARMRIGLKGLVNVDSTWCRQINPDATAYKFSDGTSEESKSKSKSKPKSKSKQKDYDGKLLWSSDDTLKVDNVKVIPGTYANADVANTILFAAADNAEHQKALFGIRNGDAIWTGIMSAWHVNHHIIDSDVINSTIRFKLLVGAADEVRIRLGNEPTTGWMLDNDYCFGGYEFTINRDGKLFSRIEYSHGKDETGRITRSYSIAEEHKHIIKDFNPQQEYDITMTVQNVGDTVVCLINVDETYREPKVWRESDWLVKESEVPKGRIDSKSVMHLYKGPKMHWVIERIRSNNRIDNGSLIREIKVYKL